MKIHKLRFKEEPQPAPGRFRKIHEVTLMTVTTEITTAEKMVVWVNSIMIDKRDIEFLMESEG